MENIDYSDQTGKDITGKDVNDPEEKNETDGMGPITEIKDDSEVAASEVSLEPELPKRILVIDDEPSIRKLFASILEIAGYEVMLAAGGKEGLHLFKENPTDLIITDIVMPGMNGHDFMIELKKDFPDVKIIAISGNEYVGPDIELSIAQAFGADKIFAKPFVVEEILDAIKGLCIKSNFCPFDQEAVSDNS